MAAADSASGRFQPCQTARCTGSSNGPIARADALDEAIGERRPQPEQHREDREQHGRGGERQRRRRTPGHLAVGMASQAPAGEPVAVRHRQRRPDDDGRQRQPAASTGVAQRGEGRFLGDEAEEQRDPSHRPRGDHGGDGRRPPAGPGTGDPPEVARAVPLVEDADDHERRRLERGVRHEQHAAGDGRLGGTPPEDRHHEPQLADRAHRQQQLQVGLAQGPEPAGDHRHHADTDDDRPPPAEIDEGRGQPADQVDAGLDHRRRVQVRADRRRRDHRRRQPALERVLR